MVDIDIYTSPYCGFCHRAKTLMNEKKQSYNEIDILNNPVQFNKMLERSGGRTSVPQIFIDKTHIGGCDELYALENSGKLNDLLKK
ncbi:MAG: glutaredoxin 3 [Rhodospirillaceae bacterium]|nr:glutaredoxin 3 [Rhodospirillaceae bacterium]OUT76271.1 MAG: glutaredoxin 3 [Rhodospirillaceae bacterium TMED23]|tara:strand:+ start:4643 stop:4900 length:258 start_codon:yes stop_codon:yes gene_type:complete